MRIPQFDDEYLYHGADSVNDDDLSHVLDQAENITRKVDNMLSFGAQVILLLEMVRDYVTGKYKSIPYRTIAAFVFSLLYVLNPIDLIPDVLPGIGILDDIMLIALVLSWARVDIQQYRAWREKSDAEKSDSDAGTPVTAPKSTHENR